MPRPFLTARWINLCIVSYAVDRALLERHLPHGLEPDTSLDGACYASVVAFEFRDTRVLGVRWPGHVHFPEINLRFYVRETSATTGGRPPRRGVCFVRELGPRRVAAWLARWWYNEPYECARLRHEFRAEPDGDRPWIAVEHHAEARGAAMRLSCRASGPPSVPEADTPAHWFKEHEWGFGVSRSRRLLAYRVEHPAWATYRVESLSMDADWAGLYGPAWGALAGREPHSVVLAAGSEVAVYRPE